VEGGGTWVLAAVSAERKKGEASWCNGLRPVCLIAINSLRMDGTAADPVVRWPAGCLPHSEEQI
jgi:hypothetical protein